MLLMRGALGALPFTINTSLINQAANATFVEQTPLVGNANPSAPMGDPADTFHAVFTYCNQVSGVTTAPSGRPTDAQQADHTACLFFYATGHKGDWHPGMDPGDGHMILPPPGRYYFTADQFALITRYNAFAPEAIFEGKAWDAVMAPGLPTCPTGYWHQATEDNASPGTFLIAGVPFHAGEIKDGRYDKAYKPTNEQRYLAERYIITGSQQVYAQKFGPWFLKSALRLGGSKGPSIRQAWTEIGVRTFNVNLAFNPIQPTVDEFNNAGGLFAWFERGGYPLMLDVLTGQANASNEAISPTVCASILCAAGSGISCNAGFITKTGGICGVDSPCSQNPSDGSASFFLRFAVDPTPGGDFHIALIWDKPSTIEKIGYYMSAALSKLADALCAVQPQAQEQEQKLLAEKCIDGKNKPCKKGATGCKCVTPPTSTAIAVGATNYYTAQWCKSWQNQGQKPPLPQPSPIPNPPKPFPWGWVIAGTIGAGLIYASRK